MLFVAARALGGKGSFGAQSCALAVFSLCNNVFSAPFTLFSQEPGLGGYLQLAVLAIGLYGIYAQFEGMRTAHGLSSLRTGVAMAATWLVLMALTAFAIGALSKSLAV